MYYHTACRNASICIQLVATFVWLTGTFEVIANFSIACETQASCSNKTLYRWEADTSPNNDTCVINCKGVYSCHNITVYSRHNQNIIINSTSNNTADILFSNSTVYGSNGTNMTVLCQHESKCVNNTVILSSQVKASINFVEKLSCNNISFLTNNNTGDCKQESQQLTDICKINIDGSWNLDMQTNILSIKSCSDHAIMSYCGCKLHQVLEKVLLHDCMYLCLFLVEN